MKLSNLKTLWGMNIDNIKQENRRYTIISTSIILSDILLMMIVTYILFKNDADFVSYAFGMLCLSFLAFFVYTYTANPNRHRLYTFYSRYKDCELVEESFDIDVDRLYSLAYCIGFRQLKANKDLDYYKEAIINYCYDDYSNAEKFYKYLSRYNFNENGEISIYKITKGKKSYFIDFKENIVSLESEDI